MLAHQLLVRERAVAVLQVEAAGAQGARPSPRSCVATVSGEPTYSAPSGPASCSNAARVTGGQPRSAPMRSRIRLEVRPELLARLLVGFGDVAGRVHADRQLGRPSSASARW